MRAVKFLKEKTAQLRKWLQDVVKAEEPELNPCNLHPAVLQAFRDAEKPIQRRETPSVMGTTSRGRNWFPRRVHGRLLKNDKTGLLRIMPEKGYRMDAAGTIWKLQAA